MLYKKLFLCWLITFLVPLFAYGQGAESINPVKVDEIISFDKLHPGSRFHVAVIIDVSDEWHINAHVPSEDYLIPTELRFEDESGLKFSEIIYPSPVLKAFSFSDQKLSVYEGRAIIGARASVSEQPPTKELIIRCQLIYQACSHEMCLIPKEVEVNIPVEVTGLEQPIHRINDEVFSTLEVRWANAHYNLGKNYEAKGLIDEAIMECEEAIMLKPKNYHYLNILSVLYVKKGNYDKAIKTIKKAIVLNPEDESLKKQLRKFEETKNR